MSRNYHILFLCVANSCRSQMAQAIGRSLAATYPQFNFDSAGQMPATQIEQGAQKFLTEKGLSFEGQYPKTLAEVMPLDEYAAVILLCEEACVILPKTKAPIHPWNLPDPSSQPADRKNEAYQWTHDAILERLVPLLEKIKGT